MSGLLPRTQNTQNQGSYENLSTGTLLVNTSAFIQSLTAGSFSPGSLTVGEVTGNPDLNVTAGTVTVNNDEVITADATQTMTNKTFVPAISINGTGTGTSTIYCSSTTFGILHDGDNIVLPNGVSGTIALTSDIPSLTNYVTTNTTQSITGTKGFQSMGCTAGGFYAIGTKPSADAPNFEGIYMGKGPSDNNYSIEITAPTNIDLSFLDFTYRNFDYTGRISCNHSSQSMTLSVNGLASLVIDNRVRASDLTIVNTPITDNVSSVLAVRPVDGIVCVRSDIVDLGSAQTITGSKNFSATTTIGSIILGGTVTDNAQTNLLVRNASTGAVQLRTLASALTVTTKGDLLCFSTAAARLPVGTNNQILTAQSAQATGLQWSSNFTGSRVAGTSAAPTIVAGVALGTGPTVAIAGSELGGVITLTAGTSPTSGILCTITNTAFANTNYSPQVVPGSLPAAQIGGAYWVNVVSTTQWTISVVSAFVITAGQQYVFRYQIQA